MSAAEDEKKCKNCEKIATQSLRQHRYCDECFHDACLHLFRATFGKHRIVRDGERVLVAISGGPSSLALLLLVQLGLSAQTNRKLRFSPLFFHLDEEDVQPKFGDTTAHLRKIFEDINLELEVMSFRQLLPSASGLIAALKEKAEVTSRLALHELCRRKALLAAARHFGCSRVLLGENATRLAGRAMEEVLQGRGMAVGAVTAFADQRFSPTLLRPMLELSSSECAALVTLSAISPPPEPRGPFSRSAGMASLQGLTARVLRDLEPSFPATNFAIVRTAAKIESEGRGTTAFCRLCEGGIDLGLTDGQEPRESAAGDLRFCHDLASGQAIFASKDLCYSCCILAHKNSHLRDWLKSDVVPAAALP